MAYFPFYFEVNRLKGVIIGGGRIALEKVQKLEEYDAELTVIAPEVLPEISNCKCVKNIIKRELIGSRMQMFGLVGCSSFRLA